MEDKRMTYNLFSFVNKHTGMDASHFNSLNESAQIQISDKILDKIFDSMMKKYDKINFEDIPATKGNIAKFKYYDNMSKCIDTLYSIAGTSNDFTEAIVLKTALNNMIKLTPVFENGFMRKNSYVVILYNAMTLALFEGTSAIISAMVDFIKTGEEYNVVITKYKNSSQMVLLKSLIEFNNSVQDGSLMKYVNQTMEPIHEAVGTAIAIGTALKIGAAIIAGASIIPILKQLIYLFFHTKNKIADSAKVQADFLETNIEILKGKTGDYTKVIAKQEKVANFFRGVARVFAINNDKAQHDADKEVRSEPNVDTDEIIL